MKLRIKVNIIALVFATIFLLIAQFGSPGEAWARDLIIIEGEYNESTNTQALS